MVSKCTANFSLAMYTSEGNQMLCVFLRNVSECCFLFSVSEGGLAYRQHFINPVLTARCFPAYSERVLAVAPGWICGLSSHSVAAAPEALRG